MQQKINFELHENAKAITKLDDYINNEIRN